MKSCVNPRVPPVLPPLVIGVSTARLVTLTPFKVNVRLLLTMVDAVLTVKGFELESMPVIFAADATRLVEADVPLIPPATVA